MQYSSSGWWYATDATTYYVNGWADIDGNQYHFDSNGYMATGWKAIGGKGCYFDDQGVYQPDRNGSMMVALTFDDGPGVYTSTLLDTLEQYGAQATFFMLGSNVEKYGADVIPRMAAIGCELGNHSYAHPNMKELSTDDGLAQFQMTDDLIAQYNNGQVQLSSVSRMETAPMNCSHLSAARASCGMSIPWTGRQKMYRQTSAPFSTV